MSFLTVLICLLINHYWRRERRLPVDDWFESWQAWLISHAHRLPGIMRNWSGTLPVLALLLPLMPVALLLWLAEGHLFGLLTLGLHISLVVYCLARFNVMALIDNYLTGLRSGNFEAAYLVTVDQAPDLLNQRMDDYAVMHQQFLDAVLITSFRRLFGVVFWYILLGPLAALLYFLLQLLVHTELLLEDRRVHDAWQRLLGLMEWVPARLLALAFALAGDFVAVFGRFREHLLDNVDAGRNLALVKRCAVAAIGKPDTGGAGSDFSVQAVWKLESLRDLLLRSQIVWVMVLALVILVV